MNLIVRRKCDICGTEFEDQGLDRWCRLEHVIVNRYDHSLCQQVKATDVNMDLCPTHSSDLLRFLFGERIK